jgi:hypothetical protein
MAEIGKKVRHHFSIEGFSNSINQVCSGVPEREKLTELWVT